MGMSNAVLLTCIEAIRRSSLRENELTVLGEARNKMIDGWAIDGSGNFRGIEETLKEVDDLISSRGGVDRRAAS